MRYDPFVGPQYEIGTPSFSAALACRQCCRSARLGYVPTTWSVVQIGDYDGDARSRILHPEGFGVLDDGPGWREAAGCHRLGTGRYGFQFIGVTSNSVPLVEFTQPTAVSLHG